VLFSKWLRRIFLKSGLSTAMRQSPFSLPAALSLYPKQFQLDDRFFPPFGDGEAAPFLEGSWPEIPPFDRRLPPLTSAAPFPFLAQ